MSNIGIISTRMGLELAVDTFASSGSLSHVQPVGHPEKMIRSVFPGPGGYPSSPFFGEAVGAFDYDTSIFLKRIRFWSNLPGAFYSQEFTGNSFISLGWYRENQTESPDTNVRIFLSNPEIAFGEWVDVNMALPRNDTVILTDTDAIGREPMLGAYIPSSTFYYAGVPTDFQGKTAKVFFQAEIACGLDKLNWLGDSKL